MISKMVRVGVLWKFRPEEMTEMEQIAEFERTKPRLKVIYEHSNPADPEALLVMRGRTKVGYINADDKRWLAPLMEKSRRGVMIDFDHVVWPTPLFPPERGEENTTTNMRPSTDEVTTSPRSGGSRGVSAILKYRVSVDEEVVRPRLTSTDWEAWRYTFAQLDTTESMDALDYAINELMAIMEGADDAAMTLEECVEMICENCRYDLSCETSERLDACCFALELKTHPRPLPKGGRGEDTVANESDVSEVEVSTPFHLREGLGMGLLERLEAASTHRRGRRGVEEWRTWFEALVDSKRADRLMKMYKNNVRIRMGVSRVTRQQMASDLLALEQTLFALPDQLFLYIDDPAQLMHMAFYRHIPEVKQLELLSALVLRERLKGQANPAPPLDPPERGKEDTTSNESPSDVANDPPPTDEVTSSPRSGGLRGIEAMALWAKLQEAGFVDDKLQPKGNKTEAAIVADEMGECLGIDPRWQPFEELWGITGLRQKCYKAGGSAKGGVTRENVRKALK